MPKYIDIDHEIQEMQQAIEENKDSHILGDKIASHAFELMIKKFQSLPPADVIPVIHAHWINTDFYDGHHTPIFECSYCHKEVADNFIKIHNYCLHCGAKMDEEKKK